MITYETRQVSVTAIENARIKITQPNTDGTESVVIISEMQVDLLKEMLELAKEDALNM